MKRLLSFAILTALTLTAAPGVARAQQSLTIPLYVLLDDNGNYRVGIQVSLGNGPFHLYELDTGNPAFSAAFDTKAKPGMPNWWGPYTYTTKPPTNSSITFDSGITYNFQVVKTNVFLGSQTYGYVVARNVLIDKITQGYGSNLGPVNSGIWNSLIAQGKPPLHGIFWGNFGAGLFTSSGLCSILGQLPGNYATGFIIHLGNQAHPNPYLIVGLTDQMRALFPYAIAMPPVPGPGGKPLVYPHSGYELHSEQPISATYTISYGNISVMLRNLLTVLDTGAPSSQVRSKLPKALILNAALRPGVMFQMQAMGDGTPNLDFSYSAGSAASFNLVTYAKNKKSYANINLGLNPYFHFDVMYDLQDNVVRLRPLRVAQPAG
jgi:hypothetical protein